MAENDITLTTLHELIILVIESTQRLRQDFSDRFDGIDRRFEGIDKRFDRVDERFDRMDERFDRMDKRFDRMDERVDRIESVQNKMALRLISVETILTEHSAILGAMQTRLNALHGLVEELERRTGRIEQEYVMITEALRRLETRFDKLEAARLQERITALEARVQALETAQA